MTRKRSKLIIILITIVSLFIISSTITIDSLYAIDNDYTTVEDAAGKADRIKRDIIDNDYITVKDAAGKNKRITYNKTKYNPGLAAFASLFPFYSGSCNPGFNGLGLYFIFMKIGSLGAGLAIYFIVPTKEPKQAEQLINSFYFLIALYASSTIGDMIYSGVHVRHQRNEILKKIEKKHRRRKMKVKRRRHSFNVFPRFYLKHNEKRTASIDRITIEGINISAHFRF